MEEEIETGGFSERLKNPSLSQILKKDIIRYQAEIAGKTEDDAELPNYNDRC